MSNDWLQMRPQAVVQGKTDRVRSHYDKLIEYPLTSSNSYTQDGDVMIFTAESGVDQQVVDRSAGTAQEKFAGVAMSDFRRITDFIEVEAKTVPSAGAYTVQVKKTTLVSTSSYVWDVTTGAALTEGNPTNATEYSVTAGGLYTFNVARAGDSLVIRYSYNPTSVELNSRFPQPAYVQQGQSFLNQVAIAVGYCEIYTTQYESEDAWALQDKVYTGAAGKFTKTTTAVMVAGRVISLPTVGDPYLGVAYNAGTAYSWA